MSRPTEDPPNWATGSGAQITEPPAQRKEIGWVTAMLPPADYWNWWMNLVGQWLTHLSTGYPSYSTLEAAYADLPAGGVAWVDENDRDQLLNGAGGWATAGGTAGVSIVAVCATGTGILYAEASGGHPKLALRGTPQTVVQTYTKTNAGTVNALLFADNYVVAAYGNYVECWNYTTGASLWVYNHGASVYGLAYQGERVCLAGASGTGTKHARALVISTGSVSWSYAHGSAGVSLFSVTAIPGAFVIGGNASSFASGATLRALVYLTGADAANEGGTGADVAGIAWDKVSADLGTLALAGDRTGLWMQDTNTGTINRLDTTSGATLASYTVTSGWDTYAICVDQDNVYLAMDEGSLSANGWVYCFDKVSIATKWRWKQSGDPVRSVTSDGCAVFAGVLVDAGENGLKRLYRGNKPHLFRRTTWGSSAAQRFDLNARLITPE